MISKMIWSRIQNTVSLDCVVATTAVTGCIAVLVDADRQGRAPLQGSSLADQGCASGRTLTPHQCRQLESNGYLVIDNFLNTQQVQEACHAIHILDENFQFKGSPSEDDGHANEDGTTTSQLKPRTKTRTRDRVLINRAGPLDLVRQQIQAFAKSLCNSDFQGFDHDDDGASSSSSSSLFSKDSYTNRALCVPLQMQVTICNGQQDEKEEEEGHDDDNNTSTTRRTKATIASTHNFYHKHLDSAGAHSLSELGVVGWLRSQHLRRRYLTCIVYLNENWKESDEGCLRVFLLNGGSVEDNNNNNIDKDTNEETYVDIEPLAGRMIVFSSSSQVHAVLRTTVPRYACAVWLTLEA